MNYLLDVNVVVAVLVSHHTEHARAEAWIKSLPAGTTLYLCPLTELGCLRVVIQAGYFPDVPSARTALKAWQMPQFLADTRGASTLPAWVKTPRAISDGHLLDLARSNGFELATFDDGIPGATLIP